MNYDPVGQNPTLEQVNAGSLQRIADATELMAKNYRQMQSDLEHSEKRVNQYRDWWLEKKKKNRYLRAQVTRLKNKLKASEQKGRSHG